MARFVLWGTYCTDALVKRAPYRDEHLARLKALKEQGTLVTLGPTEGKHPRFRNLRGRQHRRRRKLVEDDIYWKQGIWTALEVYPWIQAF